jgi:hypothetical protein
MGLAWAIIAIAALTGTPICGCVSSPAPVVCPSGANAVHSSLLGDSLTWWKPTVFAGVCTIAGSGILFMARGLHAKAKGTWKV